MRTRRKRNTTTGKGRDKDGQAIKPSRAGMGRPKGSRNKITGTQEAAVGHRHVGELETRAPRVLNW
jgi:hypothetical protein